MKRYYGYKLSKELLFDIQQTLENLIMQINEQIDNGIIEQAQANYNQLKKLQWLIDKYMINNKVYKNNKYNILQVYYKITRLLS